MLGLTVGCRIWCVLPSAAVVLDSVASFGYREPKGVTVGVFVLILSTIKCIRIWVLCRIRTDMIWHDIRSEVGLHDC